MTRNAVGVAISVAMLVGCGSDAAPVPAAAGADADATMLDRPLARPPAGDRAMAQSHLEAARAALARDDAVAGRAAFAAAIAADPGCAPGRIDYGFLLLEGGGRGGLGAALEQFRLAALLLPGDPMAACGEGIVRVELGDHERAGPLLEAALVAPAVLALPGRAAAALAALARIDEVAGRRDAALRRYGEILRLPGVPPPARAHARCARAQLMIELDRAADARLELDAALALAPRQLAARHLRARLRQQAGDSAGAAYDRAIHELARQLEDHAARRFIVDAERTRQLEAELAERLAQLDPAASRQ